MSRRRWRITLLAAAATLGAVYPITSLFQSSSWLAPAIVLIAVSAGVGLLMRGLTRSRVLVVLVQLVVAAYLILVQFAGDTFTLLLPTISTLESANNYGLEALDTIRRYSAPAPLSDGVTFYLVAAVALVAICVDAMAATWRSPAAAGLPLLTAYLITAANGDSALALRYFLVPAALWLVMVHTTARSQFGRWSTTSATDEHARALLPYDGAALRAFSSGAAKLGLIGLLVALVVPVVVPHFPPRYLTEGLGRTVGNGGGGGGSVGFNNTIDLTRSLNNDDDSPVLSYTTTGLARTPLRVLATAYYSRGEWLAIKDTAQSGEPQPLPPPKDRVDYEMTVSDNTLAAPNIAAPYPVVAVAMEGTPWTIDPITRDVRVSQPVSSYRVTFADVAPLPSALRESGKPDSPDIVDDDLAVPDTARALLESWSKKITAGKTNPLDRAIAIQDHLRSPEYTYTLDLGEPLRDSAGRIVEPIRTFYENKRGYCVQFATAMIMLARAQGIPARMAIGFLPGTSIDGKNVVRASDAHAWPELFFQGYGWLRFEPTPGARSGTPPPYAVEGAGDGARGAGRAASESATGGAKPQAPALPSAARSEAAVVASPSFSESLGSVFSLRNIVLALTVLVLLLAVFVMPITASLSRARRRREAVTRQDLVEVEWSDLTSHLRDLGLPAPAGDTLRQTRDRFIRDGHLATEQAEAVRRVTTTLERSRYDRPERTSLEQTESLHRDIREIRREVGRTRSATTRLRSFLWPEAGVSIWRGLPSRVSSLFTRDGH